MCVLLCFFVCDRVCLRLRLCTLVYVTSCTSLHLPRAPYASGFALRVPCRRAPQFTSHSTAHHSPPLVCQQLSVLFLPVFWGSSFFVFSLSRCVCECRSRIPRCMAHFAEQKDSWIFTQDSLAQARQSAYDKAVKTLQRHAAQECWGSNLARALIRRFVPSTRGTCPSFDIFSFTGTAHKRAAKIAELERELEAHSVLRSQTA